MKKVMIGILILIPVLILVIIAAVSSILKVAAHIAVENISVISKETGYVTESIDNIEFSGVQVSGKFSDFVTVKVMPDYANRYSIEWRISDVQIMDDSYQKEYDGYKDELKAHDDYLNRLGICKNQIKALEDDVVKKQKELDDKKAEIDASSLPSATKREQKAELDLAFNEWKANQDKLIDEKRQEQKRIETSEPEVRYVANAAMLVDGKGKEVTTNTSSEFVINSYCRFTLTVQAENVSAVLNVIVKGENVQSIVVVDSDGKNNSTLKVGEKKRVNANYTPISSIVTETRWHSSDPSVAIVDKNGVITAIGKGADGKGEAFITVEANRKDNGEFVMSEVYKVTVEDGVSNFGSAFSTSKTAFTLDDIGVKLSDVLRNQDNTDYDCTGCAINTVSGIVTLTGDVAQIVTKNGTLTITKCGEDDVIIENADIYNTEAGYVFEVSGLTLKLRAIWADALKRKDGEPDGVVWTVDDEKIVTVDNGEVKAASSGFVVVSAARGGKTSSFMLNVQVKLASMNLRTGNAHFAVGLARETVFATYKYRFENSDSIDKDTNSVFIEIIDSPRLQKREDFKNESEYNEYKKQYATFYYSYKYEIVSVWRYVYDENGNPVKDNNGENKKEKLDGDFAYFSQDASEPNRLIFNPDAFEGKGKLTVTVKVSAKYPKYEGNDKYTSEEVDINVIYGVEVNNIKELRKASEEQNVYAHADGNRIDKEIAWEHVNTERGKNDLYRYYNAECSEKTFGISVMSDLRFEDEKDDDGNLIEIHDYNDIKVYGDVYGNNHWLTAERNQIYYDNAMFWIAWSNVTISNFHLRANKMGENDVLTTDETKGLQGECLQVFHENDYHRNRLSGVRIEYCILENARRAGQSYNSDFVMDGVVVRNIDSVAFYVPARMDTYVDDGVSITYPNFSHVTMNNCVYANCLSTIGSYCYERYSIVALESGSKKYEGRFIKDDLAANEEYFIKYFYDAGINTQIRQTGFLDIYNWQNVSVATIIETGDDKTDDLLQALAGDIFKTAKEFERLRYTDPSTKDCFIHMGILSSGISFGQGIMDEPIYLDTDFNDKRFGDPIRTKKLPESNNSLINVLRGFEINFFGYDSSKIKDYDLLIGSMFELNSNFIARLHGEEE